MGNHFIIIPGIIGDTENITGVIQELDITLFFLTVEMLTLPLLVLAVELVI